MSLWVQYQFFLARLLRQSALWAGLTVLTSITIGVSTFCGFPNIYTFSFAAILWLNSYAIWKAKEKGLIE